MAAAAAAAAATGGGGAGAGPSGKSQGFGFSPDEPPSQQLLQDVQNLNGFSREQLSDLVQILLTFLNPKMGVDPHEALSEFADEHGVNQKRLRSTVHGILFFFSEALKRNMGPSAVEEDLVGLGLKPDKAKVLQEQWKRNYISMSQTMVGRTLRANQLVDMQWKFGVTAASDEVNKVGECFLQLKLIIDKGNNQRENVLMEMSLRQFYQFLAQMQEANKHCEA